MTVVTLLVGMFGLVIPLVRMMAIAMLSLSQILLHQIPAALVPHDLLVVHAVTATDRLARRMIFGATGMAIGMLSLLLVMLPHRVVLRMPLMMFANVDPAMARA